MANDPYQDESLLYNKYGINLSGGSAEHPQLYIKELKFTNNTLNNTSDNLKIKDQIVGINGISMAGYTWDEAIYLIQNSEEKCEISIQRKIVLRPGEQNKKINSLEEDRGGAGDCHSSGSLGISSGSSSSELKENVQNLDIKQTEPDQTNQPPKPKPMSIKQKSFINKFGGGSQEKCFKCGKTVYHAERAIGPHKNIYHKMCLSCVVCKTNLSTGSWLDHDKLPYCKSCYKKNFGVHGAKR